MAHISDEKASKMEAVYNAVQPLVDKQTEMRDAAWKLITKLTTESYDATFEQLQDMVKVGKLAQASLDLMTVIANYKEALR